MDALTRLVALRDRPSRRIVGLSSGTSADGIDAVLVELAGSAGRHLASVSWERAERAEQSLEIIHLPDGGHDHNVLRFPYTVSELAASYGVELAELKGVRAALGARYARTFLPALLEGRYQSRSGNAVTVWISLRGAWATEGAPPAHVH
jgi:1,6-anhydro-N-acetylmuramate kinase